MLSSTQRTQPSFLLIETPDILPPQTGPIALRRRLCLQHCILIDHLDQVRDNFTRAGLAGRGLAGLRTRSGADGTGAGEERVILEVGSSGVVAVRFDEAAVKAVDMDFWRLEGEEGASF